MTVKELEQRVIELERQVKELSSEVAATNRGRAKDWRAAVEKYAGDEDLLSIFADAQKLREKDRKETRGRPPAGRKARK
jgi:hypothetical protein